MFLGDPLDAQTGLDWGLVDVVAPAGTAYQVAKGLAVALAENPPQALVACKRAIATSLASDPSDAVAQTLPLFVDVVMSSDGREGVRAFLAKEAPRLVTPASRSR